MAEIEYYRGNRDNAKNLVMKVVNSNDNNVRNSSYYLLGRLYFIEKKYDCAFECFKKNYELNTNKFIALKNMAFVKFTACEYEEAFSVFAKYYDVMNGNVDENSLNSIIYLSKKLNVFIKNIDYRKVLNMYGFNQIIDYSKDRMLKHVSKHFCQVDGRDNFREGLDLDKLIEEIKDKFTPENLYPNFCVGNSYSIYYPNIGEKGSNYVRVITLPEDKQILTLYPVEYVYDNEENSCIMNESKILVK